VKILPIFLLLFLLGCVNYHLHDYYELQVKRYYCCWPNNFIVFDTDSSSFAAGILNLGALDTVHGNYERQGNRLYLQPFYTKVELRETYYDEDTVKIQFFTRGDIIPLPKNWIIILNDAEYKIDSLGMVFFPLALGDSLDLKVSGPLMMPGGFLLKNQGNTLYEVTLDLDRNYVLEGYIRIKRNKIKSKAGSVYRVKKE
jgi:hypothetical protein